MSGIELKSMSRLDGDAGTWNNPGLHPDCSANQQQQIRINDTTPTTTAEDNINPKHRPFPTTTNTTALGKPARNDPTTMDSALNNKGIDASTTDKSAAAAAAATTTTTAATSTELGPCARSINQVQQGLIDFFESHHKLIVRVVLFVLLTLYMVYFVYALSYRFGDEGSVCLLVGTLLAVGLLLLHCVGEPLSARLREACGCCAGVSAERARTLRKRVRWLLYVVSLVSTATLLVVLVALDTPGNLISLAGLAAFVLLAWITSTNPARVDWHPVFWGLSLQFYFACLILRTRAGYEAFKWLGGQVTTFLSYSHEGSVFVFGENYRVHFFAFSILPMVAFFSSVMSVLYYLGVMQRVVSVLGRFLGFCLGTTAPESLCAAFNIFMGMTDAPLMVRPFLGRMTRSELHAIMTGGFATIAGSVLGAYIGFGVPANHLLSASVMSAPAALAISKLTYPETETVDISAHDYTILAKGKETNLIEAASAGASNSLVIMGSIAVNLLAFLSLLKFLNSTLTWFGDRAGIQDLTFELICSYVLYPVALFMGTEPGPDCRRLGELVGVKTFTNEFIAYRALQRLMDNRRLWNNYSQLYDVADPANVAYDDLDVNLTQWNRVLEKGFLSPRSEVIATYALCGFSNFGSMGILLGAMGAMAPERRPDLAAIVLRAMIAGNVACFFTACIAGLFFQEYD